MTSKTLYNTSSPLYQSKTIDKFRSQFYPQLESNAKDILGNEQEPHSYMVYKLLKGGSAELNPDELYHLYGTLTDYSYNFEDGPSTFDEEYISRFITDIERDAVNHLRLKLHGFVRLMQSKQLNYYHEGVRLRTLHWGYMHCNCVDEQYKFVYELTQGSGFPSEGGVSLKSIMSAVGAKLDLTAPELK